MLLNKFYDRKNCMGLSVEDLCVEKHDILEN